jgi:hypothetical protein
LNKQKFLKLNTQKIEIKKEKLKMTKYLQSIIGRFEELQEGIKNNYEKWRLMPDTPQSIENHIFQLENIDFQIAELKKKLSDKQAEARKLKEEKKTVVPRSKNVQWVCMRMKGET